MKIAPIAGALPTSVKSALAMLAPVMLALVMLAAPAHAEDAPHDPVSDQIHCLALNMYFEARGEPNAGMIAVGHVVMNRIKHPRFPGDACAVVKQGGERVRHRCQFSWYCDGKPDTPDDTREWSRAKAFAQAVFWDFTADPTDGATFYHADYVSPHWRTAFQRGPKIGQHIFYIDAPSGPKQLAER